MKNNKTTEMYNEFMDTNRLMAAELKEQKVEFIKNLDKITAL